MTKMIMMMILVPLMKKMMLVSLTMMRMSHIVSSIRGTSKFQHFTSFKSILTVGQFEIYPKSILLFPSIIIVIRLTIRSLYGLWKIQKDQFQIQKSEEICEIDIGRKLRRNIEAIFTRNGEIFQSPPGQCRRFGDSKI